MERALPIPTIEQAERFEAVVAWIEQHPDLHDQESWVEPVINGSIHRYADEHSLAAEEPIPMDCGTKACIAGWAAHLAGRPIYFADRTAISLFVKESGFDVPLEAWAGRYFGLHAWDNEGMFPVHPFASENTITDLRRWARAIRLAAETKGDSALEMYESLLDQEQALDSGYELT